MKKIFAAVLVIALTLSLLTACSDNSNDINNNNNSSDINDNGDNYENEDNNIGNGETFEFGVDYINNNLKGDYHIIYNITTYENGETDSIMMEQIKTQDGYYFSSDDDGMLFIKNGIEYDMYIEYDGEYEKSGISYTDDIVNSMMIGITGYMTTYAAFGSSLNKTGNQTIAGRDCAEYKFDYIYPVYGYKLKYTYYIDKATGVCLKFVMEVEGEGEKIGYEFECTAFETSGVQLPAYN